MLVRNKNFLSRKYFIQKSKVAAEENKIVILDNREVLFCGGGRPGCEEERFTITERGEKQEKQTKTAFFGNTAIISAAIFFSRKASLKKVQ